MAMALRIALILGGALLLFMASGFLLDPATAGADFGIEAPGPHGLTSIRADMTAFFGVGGACLIWGALRARPDPLLIGAALMLVTLVARLVSLVEFGSFEGYIIPMVVELVLGVLAIAGAKVLPPKTA